jgi:hypothetical protein
MEHQQQRNAITRDYPWHDHMGASTAKPLLIFDLQWKDNTNRRDVVEGSSAARQLY